MEQSEQKLFFKITVIELIKSNKTMKDKSKKTKTKVKLKVKIRSIKKKYPSEKQELKRPDTIP